jgi:hypothetical protein
MAAEPISPELVLVCPELRERVLGRLPEPAPPRAAAVPLDALAPFPIRVCVYFAVRTAVTLTEGAFFAAGIAALVLVLSLTT